MNIYFNSLVSEYSFDEDFKGLVGKMIEQLLLEHDHADAEVGIILGDDQYIRRLNSDYRGIAEPTDVLAFIYTDDTSQDLEIGREYALGEIYLSYNLSCKQALDKEISLQYELFYLIVHGLLHLLGFDHDTPDSAGLMDNKHNEIMTLYSSGLS